MSNTKRRLKVFLCHSHSDGIAVRDLFRYLRREGVDVWLDQEKLLPGADWDLEIRKAVRTSDVIVVCLSRKFNEAGYRQKEVRLALDTAMEQPEGEIFIIPARLEECDSLESLKRWHWVDLFEDGGRQRLIQALRARAETVGAALRRRRGASPVSSELLGEHPTGPGLSELSAEAKQILIGVSQDPDGKLTVVEIPEDMIISTNGKDLGNFKNPRSRATWKAAIAELESHEFLQRESKTKYSISTRGYQAAERLKNL